MFGCRYHRKSNKMYVTYYKNTDYKYLDKTKKKKKEEEEEEEKH